MIVASCQRRLIIILHLDRVEVFCDRRQRNPSAVADVPLLLAGREKCFISLAPLVERLKFKWLANKYDNK